MMQIQIQDAGELLTMALGQSQLSSLPCLMLQSLCHEPAIISLLKQQYDIDVNVRSLKSFMVFRLALVYFV